MGQRSVKLSVGSFVELKIDGLPKRAVDALVRLTTHRNPKFTKTKRLGRDPIEEGIQRTLTTHEISGGRLRMWRGCLGPVRRKLRRLNITTTLKDRRLWLDPVDFRSSIIPREYQHEPIAKMIKRQQTVGRGPAGCGKTEMLLSVIAHFAQPTLIMVWQEAQQKTWLERIPQWFDIPADQIGAIGGVAQAKPRIGWITVGLVQSVRNRLDDLVDRFGCIACDEVQRFAAPTLRATVNEFPAAIRIGASDDERRADRCEFLLYDTFGPKSWDLGKATGQAPVDVLIVPTDLTYERKGWRVQWSDVIDRLTSDAQRNRIVINLAAREFKAGGRVLIWTDRLEHSEFLRDALRKRLGFKGEDNPIGLIIGGKDWSDEADRTCQLLRDGPGIGVGTNAEQSTNIEPLDVGIMTCASADEETYRFKQMRGRLARLHESKTRSRLFYLWDRRVSFLRDKVRNIRRRYKVKLLRRNRQRKETKRMAKSVQVNLESLKNGCKSLGIDLPKKPTEKKLIKAIEEELAKNKTYGSYACEDCGRDIVNGIKVCPFCAARFKPADDSDDGDDDDDDSDDDDDDDDDDDSDDDDDDDSDDDDDDDSDDDDDDDDDDDSDDDDDDDSDDDDDDGDDDDGDDDDGDDDDDDDSDDDDDGDDDDDDDDDDKKAKAKKKKAADKKKKDKAKEEARARIRKELPYSNKALLKLKRPQLMMVAAELSIPNPVKLSTDALVSKISQKQAKKYPDADDSKSDKKSKKDKKKGKKKGDKKGKKGDKKGDKKDKKDKKSKKKDKKGKKKSKK